MELELLLLPRHAGAARTAGLLRLRQTVQLNTGGNVRVWIFCSVS